ncbi:hypothetical protein NC651_010710 [Populus alba x Populus x berolinensis]|nr:hypothetical protein NC651_010710 [Populus alba x Populus x berolinensis]
MLQSHRFRSLQIHLPSGSALPPHFIDSDFCDFLPDRFHQIWPKKQACLWFIKQLEVFCVANVVFLCNQTLLICVLSVCALKLTSLKV